MNAPLRLLLGGDVMLGRGVDHVLARHGPGHALGALAPLRTEVDAFFVNLECAIAAHDSVWQGAPKAFRFRAHPRAIAALRGAGVDLVSLANNHALDAGLDGLAEMLALLDAAGIAHAGVGEDIDRAAAPRALSIRGQRLGVLAACDHQADFAATGRRAGIHYLELREPAARAQLVALTRELAPRFDHLILSLHWLPNWVQDVPDAYRQLGQDLIAAGARLVWGHSPHHILGSEWVGTGVVLYASGDLLDDYALDPHFRNDRQLLYRIDLQPGRVERLRAIPLELGLGRTAPASAPARRWIEAWLRARCAELGSRVQPCADGSFELLPGME